jgi:predicted signal transduction protein with EAL and GGDEF domain
MATRGRNYELSAAWGAAAVPEEATTPTEAMQLADVRMYAQKESRRLASAPVPDVTVELPGRVDREALEHGK